MSYVWPCVFLVFVVLVAIGLYVFYTNKRRDGFVYTKPVVTATQSPSPSPSPGPGPSAVEKEKENKIEQFTTLAELKKRM